MSDVHEATDAEQDQVIDTLAEGFLDDPLMSWIFDDGSTRRDALRAFYRFWIDLYGPEGRLDLTGSGDGAALWASTDRPDFDEESGRRFLDLVETHTGDRTPLVMQGLLLLADHPEGRYWYLNAIAVKPQTRGRGTGAALLSPALATRDREQTPVYLESSNPRNISFYERQGFTRLWEPVTMPSNGPSVQRMWRDPA